MTRISIGVRNKEQLIKTAKSKETKETAKQPKARILTDLRPVFAEILPVQKSKEKTGKNNENLKSHSKTNENVFALIFL